MDKVFVLGNVAVLGLVWYRKWYVERPAKKKCGTGSASKEVSATPTTKLNSDGEEKPQIEISYCFRCKWGLRAAYMAQEILNTFESDLYSVNLNPSWEGGTYRISLVPNPGSKHRVVLFDRKEKGRFPEAKEMKQIIRDVMFPERELGKCLDKK